ncbi:hypothetical protein O3M35_001551 [Rhynocoris fuscipes]|uniref:PH domain-containing protein n=1 Tax=Rhynocoris fuscipes TaxID=488301 RepID=A0AAW1CRA6_9HEMI
MEGQVSERTLTPVDTDIPNLDDKCFVDIPLNKKDPLFDDCKLSSISDDKQTGATVVKRPGKRGRDGREKKRVSFHETVVGDGPKATVWERRSCDVETILGGWWTSFTSSDPGEKGEDALDMERGAPEGSDDPHLLYVETAIPALKADASSTPIKLPSTKVKETNVDKPLTVQKSFWKTSSPIINKSPVKNTNKNLNPLIRHIKRPTHVVSLCPKIPASPAGGGAITEEYDTDQNQLSLHFEKIRPDYSSMEKLFNCSVYKVYKMLETNGEACLCVLTKNELCFISLTKEHNLSMQRIQYRDLKYVRVGPCDEQISLEGGRKLICASRGGELCSWLHYAVFKETGKILNFPRIEATDVLRSVSHDSICEDVLYCTWTILSNEVSTPSELALSDHLMFSIGTLRRFWEPALVEIREGKLLLKPSSRSSRSLSLHLDECVSCERLLTSRCQANRKDHRPHTFCLRFEKQSPRDTLILCLAASDDRSVSNWMEVILKQCKGGWKEYHNNDRCLGLEGQFLMLTPHSILLLSSNLDDATLKSENKNRLISRTSVQHVSAILTGPAYIILELDCHEVEDKASDWLLYFLSEEIKTSFVEFLINIKPQLQSMVFDHKGVSCSWAKCEMQSRDIESRFEPLRNYLNSITTV